MINYTVSDMITRIRNAIRVKKTSVILRLTAQTQRISEILKREGYIEEIILQKHNTTTESSMAKSTMGNISSEPHLMPRSGNGELTNHSFAQKSDRNALIYNRGKENQSRGTIILHLKYGGKQRMEQGKPSQLFNLTERQTPLRGNMRPVFSNLQCISRPGVRSYAKSKNIPQILGGLGILIISTNQGIMTDREARERNLGGELLFSIW
jgi:ribosomal protein S8